MRSTIFLILLAIAILSSAQQFLDADLVQKAYDAQNPNVSLEYLSQMENLETLSDTLKNKAYLSYGIAYGKLGKVDSSMYFLNRCIANAQRINDDFYLMRAFNSKGVLLRIQGDHERSLEAFQNALRVAEQHSERSFETAKSDILGNIGGIFYQLKDYESARVYSSRGLTLAKQFNDTSELAYGYLRLAIVAQAQDSLQKSLDYNQSASQFLEVLGDLNTLVYVESNLGNIYKDQGNYKKALIHHRKANGFAEMLGDEEAKSHAILSIGESYFQLRQLNQAREFALKGLAIAETGNFPIQSKNAHNLLFKIAESSDDFKEALKQNKLVTAINDSLNAAEARERLAEVETKYETEKKQAEINRLSLENELKDSRLLGGGIVGGLVIIILIVFFTQRSKKQRAEKEAQELQIEAMKKRFMELHSSPAELAVELDFEELNTKLNTPLTEREFESLKLSIEGKTNTEIGEILFISVSTVKFHLRNTYSKMGVGNRKEAFQYMLKTS